MLPPGTPPPGATDGATGRKVERERRMVGRERERTVVNATLLASTSRQASSHFVLCWPWFLRGAAFFPAFLSLNKKNGKFRNSGLRFGSIPLREFDHVTDSVIASGLCARSHCSSTRNETCGVKVKIRNILVSGIEVFQQIFVHFYSSYCQVDSSGAKK